MLGPEVTGITLVFAEKVKFIAFTFPNIHRVLTRYSSDSRAGPRCTAGIHVPHMPHLLNHQRKQPQ